LNKVEVSDVGNELYVVLNTSNIGGAESRRGRGSVDAKESGVGDVEDWLDGRIGIPGETDFKHAAEVEGDEGTLGESGKLFSSANMNV
jgi:hypothetical protein